MSKSTKSSKFVHVLSQGEVNKKILARSEVQRNKDEILGPFDIYRRDYTEIFNRKKSKFNEACKIYKEVNGQTFVSTKQRLHDDYEQLLDYSLFSEKIERPKMPFDPRCGTVLRKRIPRGLNEEAPVGEESHCIEPWFTRKRMTRNLAKLKHISELRIDHYERNLAKCVNESYADIFEKYLLPFK